MMIVWPWWWSIRSHTNTRFDQTLNKIDFAYFKMTFDLFGYFLSFYTMSLLRMAQWTKQPANQLSMRISSSTNSQLAKSTSIRLDKKTAIAHAQTIEYKLNSFRSSISAQGCNKKLRHKMCEFEYASIKSLKASFVTSKSLAESPHSSSSLLASESLKKSESKTSAESWVVN